MSYGCTFEGCTVSETGVCALERDPATCEYRSATDSGKDTLAETSSVAGQAGDIGNPVLEKPASATAPFTSSHTLGPDLLSTMMGSRYISMIGILGDPESGKTACLASLYLLVSNAQLEGWSFADSRSLMAFEDIARGARQWNEGRPPEQMTMHTEMADDRRPGFLHLRLVREVDGCRVDLALPDLPGEWTNELIVNARSDRFEFMKSAEALWVVTDGVALRTRERAQSVISRLGQLVGRLKKIFDGTIPRLMVVITHRDRGALNDSIVERIRSELAKRNVEPEIYQVAPFSDSGDVDAGYGLADLVENTMVSPRNYGELWPNSPPRGELRAYLRFRRDQ